MTEDQLIAIIAAILLGDIVGREGEVEGEDVKAAVRNAREIIAEVRK